MLIDISPDGLETQELEHITRELTLQLASIRPLVRRVRVEFSALEQRASGGCRCKLQLVLRGGAVRSVQVDGVDALSSVRSAVSRSRRKVSRDLRHGDLAHAGQRR